MTTFRPKLWTGVSLAIMLAAAAGCSGETGDTADTAATNALPPAAGEGGEGGAEGGPGAGEVGAQNAYISVPPESRLALRLAHMEGFLLVAQKQPDGADAAAALIGQGMIEVFDAQPDAFRSGGVNEALLRKAAETGSPADIAAAIATIEAAQAKASGDQAAVTRGMVDIAAGLYAGVFMDGEIDPIEYQHAYGAALSAQQLAEKSSDPKVKAAKADIDKLVALWPAAVVPAKPTPVGQVSAQASRVELALS